MILIENKFTKLILHEKYADFIWFETSGEMTDEEYKEILLEYADMIEKHRPTKIIADLHQLKFFISPDLQKWTDDNVFNRTLAAGLVKDAYITPKEIIAHMSTEQLFDEENVRTKKQKFFDNREDALAWLLSDN